MIKRTGLTRRQVLSVGATAAAIPLVNIRPASAATKISIGFFDHLVPAGNEVMRQQVQAWAKQANVEVQADFITTSGNRLVMTAAAEAQSSAGHDVLAFSQWDVQNHADKLEPMDDVVKTLTDRYGPVSAAAEYLGRQKGTWHAVPTTSGTLNFPVCARIGMLKKFAGIDVQEVYPARVVDGPQGENWTYDTFLKAAEACQAAGHAFAIPIGQTSDAINPAGSMFAAFGAELVDKDGQITVESDAVRQFLQWGQRYVRALPADAASYDDASNNRGLISGQSALIIGPPSAWATAKRDNPQVAEDCWTFPLPAGPKGRMAPAQVFFWGLWKFSKNKQPAKELVTYLMGREQIEERATAVQGYDIPPFKSLTDFKIWEEVGPPKGTLFNYPDRPSQQVIPHIACSPAPPEIAVQIYNRAIMPSMLARLKSGQSIEQVVSWAKGELDGFVRSDEADPAGCRPAGSARVLSGR